MSEAPLHSRWLHFFVYNREAPEYVGLSVSVAQSRAKADDAAHIRVLDADKPTAIRADRQYRRLSLLTRHDVVVAAFWD
jgi:hypothetical protein